MNNKELQKKIGELESKVLHLEQKCRDLESTPPQQHHHYYYQAPYYAPMPIYPSFLPTWTSCGTGVAPLTVGGGVAPLTVGT